jgi:hypothetical protein
MKVKEVEIEEIKTEVINTYEMVDRYYWSSRSVYAVEFEHNIFQHDPNNNWSRMKLIEVKFEDNIIKRKYFTFCDKHPIIPNKLYRKEWYDELFYAYTQEDKYYDYRTKEQFNTDFNAVINNLQELRN